VSGPLEGGHVEGRTEHHSGKLGGRLVGENQEAWVLCSVFYKGEPSITSGVQLS